MNILVINGSPKGERSDCMKITNAFLEGYGESAEVIDSMKVNVQPCLGCFFCWQNPEGKCVHNDDMAGIIEKMRKADLLIWSTPLYCYSVPSNCKAIIDRMLPMSRINMYVDEEGRTHHTTNGNNPRKHMLISGSGFPDNDGNFDGLKFQFRRLFGKDIPMILTMESPLVNQEEAQGIVEPYMKAVMRAGDEMKREGRISDKTQAILDAPMLDPDIYRSMVNEE